MVLFNPWTFRHNNENRGKDTRKKKKTYNVSEMLLIVEENGIVSLFLPQQIGFSVPYWLKVYFGHRPFFT